MSAHSQYTHVTRITRATRRFGAHSRTPTVAVLPMKWRRPLPTLLRRMRIEEGVLADRRRILGPEHHDTLTAEHNLAL